MPTLSTCVVPCVRSRIDSIQITAGNQIAASDQRSDRLAYAHSAAGTNVMYSCGPDSSRGAAITPM